MNTEEIRESLKAAGAVPTEQVTLINGVTYTVQGLTIGQRDQLEGTVATLQSGKRSHFRALLVSWSLLNDRGQRAYVGPEVLDELSHLSAQLLEPIVTKAMELSGITRKDLEEIAPEDEGDPAAAEVFEIAGGTSSSTV